MKVLHLPILALLLTTLPAIAGKEAEKDFSKLSAEARSTSEALLKEAKWLEEKAASLAGKDATAVSRFAKTTRAEAESLGKAADAWTKNQKRLAEKHMKDAAEFCSDRGKMHADIKHLLEEPAKGEKCEPKKGEACKPDPAKKDSPNASNEIDKLHEEISRLGKPSAE